MDAVLAVRCVGVKFLPLNASLPFRWCVRSCDSDYVVTVERAVVVPDCPGDPRQLVGVGDGGFVRVTFARPLHGPGLQLRERQVCGAAALGGGQGRARAVAEEHAHVGIALLADAAESSPAAGGELARREAEPAGRADDHS